MPKKKEKVKLIKLDMSAGKIARMMKRVASPNSNLAMGGDMGMGGVRPGDAKAKMIERLKMITDQESVFDAISEERMYQDEKMGDISHHQHSIPEWLLMMRKLIEKAETDWMNNGNDEALKSLLKATSIGVACMEQHGVKTPDNRPR